MSFFSHCDIELDRMKQWIEHTLQEVKQVAKPIPYEPGVVVTPTDMTVLETDDYVAAANMFTASGRIEFNIVTPGCLLLVLSAAGSNLRVLCLDTGRLGQLHSDSVAAYQ